MPRHPESDEAYARVKPVINLLQTIVLDYIRAHGPCRDIDMVPDLIEEHGHRGSTWRTRRSELVDKGLVEKCGSDGKHGVWRVCRHKK